MRVWRLRGSRPFLVTLGWGVSISSFALAGIFQGGLVPAWLSLNAQAGNGLSSPTVFYLEVLGVSILAGMVMDNIAKALLSLFVSFGLAALITYFVLALPAYLGISPIGEAIFGLAIVFTFSAMFPFPLILGLAGTVLGTGLAERFF